MSKILTIFLVTIFLGVAGFVQAIALKVQPAEIEVQASPGELSKQELQVTNPDSNIALFEVYPDNFSDIIKVSPESFILESGKSQKVSLEIKAKETGIFSTNISIVAKPMAGQKFKANSGVKIPIQVSSVNKNPQNFSAFLAGFWQLKFWPLVIVSLVLVTAILVLLLHKIFFVKIKQDETGN